MKNKKLLWSFLIIILVAGIYWAIQSDFFSPKDPIYIVVTVPSDDPSASLWTRTSINSIQMYIDQANAEGGVNGHPLKLDIKVDKGDPAEAERVAQEITAEGKAMIVLGNSYSNPATAIAKVFEANKIPAMTAGATAPSVTEGNDWFFRVIGDNRSQGRFVAEYTSALLEHKSVAILYEDNVYGESLGSAFEESFKEQGGIIIDSSAISTASENLDNEIEEIITAYTETPDVVFLATYKAGGVAATIHLRNHLGDIPIIGGDDLGVSSFATAVAEKLGSSTQANEYTRGIYAASPLIFDVASEAAQIFNNNYYDRFNEAPFWFAATSYDSALVAVEAMRAAGISGDSINLQADRQRLRDYLHAANTVDEGFDGITGKIHFDDNHNFTQPMAMGIFENNSFISAPVQLYSINFADLPNDYIARITDGSLLRAGNNFFGKTQIVYVGVDINEFDDLDIDGEHTYLVDFYLWFRYEGEKLDFEDIKFDNMVEESSLGDPVDEKVFDDGSFYSLFKMRETFRNSFDLSDYPFDKQQLLIKLRHTTLERKDLIFVTDTLGLGTVSKENVLNSLKRARAFETITDWLPVNGYFFADTVRDFGTRGDPTLFNNKSEIEHSRFNAGIEVRRDVFGFTSKTMMPVFWIIVLAYLGLYLPGREFETITGLMTGTVLSVVFFHVDLSGRLNVGYTVALDYAFYAIYALLATELFLSIIAWHKSVKNEDDKAIRVIFWAMRTLYPLVLIGTIIFSIIHYEVVLSMPF